MQKQQSAAKEDVQLSKLQTPVPAANPNSFIHSLIMNSNQSPPQSSCGPLFSVSQQPSVHFPPQTGQASQRRKQSSQSISNSRSDSQESRSLSPYPKSEQLDQNSGQNIPKTQPNKQANKQEKPNQRKRYKYCCKTCKHTDKSKKACVCVVPLGQRRTLIGDIGCQTCGCKGCSKEDYISRGQDPQYKPQRDFDLDQKRTKRVQGDFQARNGCCKQCMKAFSRSGKACLCQVPQQVRKGKLPSTGCKTCSCFGCNPEDKKQRQRGVQREKQKRERRNSRSRSRDRKHRKHRSRSRRRRSQSSKSRQEVVDPIAMNFYNIDRSVIGSMMLNEYQLSPLIFGFGVPQRSQSYIIGRPK